MKAKKLITTVITVSLCTPAVWARDQKLPTMHTATTATSTTTTTVPSQTIQSLGQQAAAKSDGGTALAKAGMAITAFGAAATCIPTPGNPALCKVFLAGLAATTLVSMLMGKSSGTSNDTVKAVSTSNPTDPYNLNNNGGSTDGKTGPAAPDYQQQEEYKNAMNVIKQAEGKGWKVDLKKGLITDPKGKTFSTAMVNSADSMRAAGVSEANIKAYQNEMNKIPALAAEKAKAADGAGDLYGDSAVGGGGAKTAGSADGGNPYAGLDLPTGPKLGIDRDPAQVAGMSKDFNGNPIGVSQDSLFKMIDRRYELHNKNGSFLSP